MAIKKRAKKMIKKGKKLVKKGKKIIKKALKTKTAKEVIRKEKVIVAGMLKDAGSKLEKNARKKSS